MCWQCEYRFHYDDDYHYDMKEARSEEEGGQMGQRLNLLLATIELDLPLKDDSHFTVMER